MDWGLSRVGLALIGLEFRETQQHETAPATSSEVQPRCRDFPKGVKAEHLHCEQNTALSL